MNVNSVTSLSQSSYLTYKTGRSNRAFFSISTSLYRSKNDDTSDLRSTFFTADQYSSSRNTNLLEDALTKRLAEQKQTLATLKAYSEKSDKFYSKFFPTMSNLKTSANTLADTDFSASDKSSIMKDVKQFTSDYNSTVDFLANNASTSTGLLKLSISFSSTKFNSRAYGSIGIKVDTSGRLSVDEAKFAASLADAPDQVNQLIGGSHGLAAKTMRQTKIALTNTNNLVPLPTISKKAYNSVTQSMLFNIFA
ncbi:MAG: Flagellar hook-associated protein 2 C-terminus [Firmicutes bacterium]|nr:Flagellar hook-associated protein 2 C-terminus [Bacillota bacterium]